MNASHVNNPIRKCTRCHAKKPENDENFKRRGDEFAATCRACSEKRSRQNTSQDAEKENADTEEIEDERLCKELGNIGLQEFLNTILETRNVTSFAAFVDISELGGSASDTRERANKLSQAIWERLNYRFTSTASRYMYHCTQNKSRQHKVKKSDGAKHRDKGQMDTFRCHGWLHITVWPESNMVLAKLKHEEEHVGYWNVEVPKEIKEMIEKRSDMDATQLWDDILQKDPSPKFSRKAVYELWHERSCREWKRDKDELKSAKLLLEEASQSASTFPNGSRFYTVENIPVHNEDGFSAIAFSLPEVLRKYGGKIREVLLDSAWNTNGSNYEVYALMGEISGSGCPLGYLLIQSAPNSERGGKERYLQDLLDYFRKKWKISPIITLTDKDLSEINAFLAKFPEAKHQLCFWHCLRAVKTRLSILRRKPKFYDVKEARMEYPWIDESFVPIGQLNEPLSEAPYLADKAIPHVKVLFQGVLQNQAPKPDKPTSGRIALRLNGRVQAVLPLKYTAPVESEDADGEIDTAGSDGDSDDEAGDLLDKVSQAYDQDKNARDSEDGPDWMFEDGEKTSSDPDYVFCPAAHRKQILHIFTKHFCQHPSFPDRHGTWTEEEIRNNAVKEMYDFCKARGLREVWGYMWACWYTPKMWKLWARSTSPYISRLRTTMGVENFWRQLKHEYLHNITRPRLDQLVWVLIRKVTPRYLARMRTLEDDYRLGRSKTLTTYQKYFKAAWKRLESRPTTGKEYQTNISEWTCNCGRQKYDPHHLCKHLVQAVGHPAEPRFWWTITRRRVKPLYRHPLLVPKGTAPGDYIEPDSGSITDGDDHLWSGNPSVLKGGGGWKSLQSQGLDKGPEKRTRDLNEGAAEGDDEERDPKRARHVEIIDLTSSSPSASPRRERSTSAFDNSDASSAFDYGSDDEVQLDMMAEDLLDQATDLEKLADIIRKQVPHRNRIWMGTVTKSLGRHLKRITEFVDDIEHHERHGRKRGTTWGEGGSKEDRRRATNTMGYVLGQHA